MLPPAVRTSSGPSATHDFNISAARLHPALGNRLEPDISAQGSNFQIAHRGIDANIAAAGANEGIAQPVVDRYRAAHGLGAQQFRIVNLNVAAMGLEIEMIYLSLDGDLAGQGIDVHRFRARRKLNRSVRRRTARSTGPTV